MTPFQALRMRASAAPGSEQWATPSGATLSNGNRTATVTTGGIAGGYGADVRDVGKFYFEIAFTGTQISGGRNPAFGVGTNDGNPIAGAASGIGGTQYSVFDNVNTNAWRVVTNGSNGPFVFPTIPDSGVFGVAFDAGTGDGWYLYNGATINGGDPAAGTGADFTLTASLNYHALWRVNAGVAATATLKASAGNLSYSPPSGFSPWV